MTSVGSSNNQSFGAGAFMVDTPHHVLVPGVPSLHEHNTNAAITRASADRSDGKALYQLYLGLLESLTLWKRLVGDGSELFQAMQSQIATKGPEHWIKHADETVLHEWKVLKDIVAAVGKEYAGLKLHATGSAILRDFEMSWSGFCGAVDQARHLETQNQLKQLMANSLCQLYTCPRPANATVSAPLQPQPTAGAALSSRRSSCTSANVAQKLEGLDIGESEAATLDLLSNMSQFRAREEDIEESKNEEEGSEGAVDETEAEEEEETKDGCSSGSGATGRRRRRKRPSQCISAAGTVPPPAGSLSHLELRDQILRRDAGHVARTACFVCDKAVGASDHVACSYGSCGQLYHKGCIGMGDSANSKLVPKPWFCSSCVAPTIRHLELIRRATNGFKARSKRSLAEFALALEGGGTSAMNNAENVHTQFVDGQRPSSPKKRKKYEFKNEMLLKRNPHQTTILDLVENGLLKTGDVICVPYLNKHTFEGVINSDGLIEFEDQVFISPPSFALYCKRKIYPAKQSDRGWTSCFFNGKPLLLLRNKLASAKK